MSTKAKPKRTRRPDLTAEEKKLFYAARDDIRAEEPQLSVRAYAYRIGGLMNIYLHGDLCTKEAPAPGEPPVNEETIQRLILKGRREGRLPYESIIDGTRPTSSSGEGWDDRDQAVRYVRNARQNTIDNYSLAIWRDQGKIVQCLSEKETLEPIVSRVTDALEVDLTSCKGFSSESMLYRLARAAVLADLPTTFLILTDHDRAGYNMAEHVERVIRRLARLISKQRNRPMPSVTFDRIGLNAEQVARYGITTRPCKESEKPHWHNHTPDCAEVDFLRSVDIEEVVREGILRHLDTDVLAATQEQQTADIAWLSENV